MSTQQPTANTVSLDRAQRKAVRRELGIYAHRGNDVEHYFDQGDRESVVRILEILADLVMVMDAIGWQESAEAPDRQDVIVSDALAAWAGPAADDVAQCWVGSIPLDPDSDLDALSALRLMAGVS
jgi:hypothetical protein